MDELTIYRRRRDGGDVPGVVRRRRRDGGDILLRRREATTPVTPASMDVVEQFLKQHPFYIAHRMGGAEYPEFTQNGLEGSLRRGFKALEVSVRLCAKGQDGEPAEFVAIHDWKTTRTVRGTDLPIWSTPWSTLRTLQQGTGPFMRLQDIVDQIPDDVVLAIDHKTTSSEDQRNPADLQAEEQLFEYLDTAFGGHPERRVIWKVFAKGTSATRAKARGYRTMAMLYPEEVPAANLNSWDVIGMEWNASADVWNRINATGKPTIAHIILTNSQARAALDKGASGLMVSFPARVHP
ncbi:glycerophosphodiester phosphodiesterase [Xylanimonas cellulosilytica]|uniref:glycerophosphodiester phosphodiesterase n=1 Tax=Xylanimonas cellulosilytica TaxID=186189 RepID=UPI00069DAD3E|nr:hypothetical protein [Xylanimonas cellulosilytica]